MDSSRRQMIKGVGLSLAAVAAGGSSSIFAAEAKSHSSPRLPDKAIDIVSFDLLQQQAKGVMSEAAYAYIAHAAGEEWTMNENRRAFHDYPISTHRLSGIDAKSIDTQVDILGHKLEFPILVAPMGAHMFAHPDGEVATAAGAAAAGAIYESSGASNKPLEAIAKASKGPKWFQLYFNADLGVTRSLLTRAKEAGYTAIILTADALGPGMSDEFMRLGKPFPPGFSFGNHDPRFGGSGNFMNQKINLTPDDIEFIKSVTGLPVVVKGLMRGVDADAAIKAGASAVQVSNHGGRQLDGVPGAISVLKEVVDAVEGRVPVLFDSGIRRGIDVFEALSLGASAVAVGRPVLYGLSVAGASGVQAVVQHLRNELRQTMLLAGAKSVRELSSSYLRR